MKRSLKDLYFFIVIVLTNFTTNKHKHLKKTNKISCTQVEVDTTVYNRAGGKGSYEEFKVKRMFYVMFFLS